MKYYGRRIAIAAMAWTTIGLVFELPSMLRGQPFNMAGMVNWWLWGVLGPLISAVDDRLQAACKRPLPLLAAHAGFGVLLTAFYVGAAATLEYGLGLNPWAPLSQPQFLFDWFAWALIVYGLILAALKAYKYYRRHAADELQLERLSRRVLESRLNALRLQLDPHLVFDALKGISACVEQQPRLARKMIEHLGDLLRFSLAMRNRQYVTLAEEFSFLQNYFALQRLHFGERLTVTLSAMPDVEQVRIPPLLLQPLVENAIRHGVAGRAGGGNITVSARRAGARLEVRVADDGAGLPLGWQLESAQGQGLSVTRERLSAMYPAGECGFAIGRRAAGGTEATITLPLDLVEGDRNARAFI